MKRSYLVLAMIALLVLSLMAPAGCRQVADGPPPDNGAGDEPDDTDTGEDPEPGQTMTLTLWFRNRSFEPGVSAPDDLLITVDRVVPHILAVARAAVLELIAGPTVQEQEMYDVGAVIRPDAELVDILLVDGLLVVDLHYEGPVNEMLALHHEDLAFVQAFVTTLTEFPTVDRVWVLKDGRPWLGGSTGWCCPLARRGEEMEFTLYYGDDQAARDWAPGEWGFVMPVTVPVVSPPATIWENCPFATIIHHLTQDPGDGLLATLPSDNTLGEPGFEFDLESRILTINLLGSCTMGHAMTRMLIESLVFTFTDVPIIDGVMATLNGDLWNDGHFVWEEPFTKADLLGD